MNLKDFRGELEAFPQFPPITNEFQKALAKSDLFSNIDEDENRRRLENHLILRTAKIVISYTGLQLSKEDEAVLRQLTYIAHNCTQEKKKRGKFQVVEFSEEVFLGEIGREIDHCSGDWLHDCLLRLVANCFHVEVANESTEFNTSLVCNFSYVRSESAMSDMRSFRVELPSSIVALFNDKKPH